MDPISDLSRRAERLRSQIREESDKVLRREMVKTYKSYNKEIRRATRNTSPESKFFFLLLFLLIILGGSVSGLTWLQHAYGWKFTVTSVLLSVGTLIIVTAMVFLLLKIISPELYKDLVQTGLYVLRWVYPGNSIAKSDSPVSISSAAPDSPGSPPALPAPDVSFEEGRGSDSGQDK